MNTQNMFIKKITLIIFVFLNIKIIYPAEQGLLSQLNAKLIRSINFLDYQQIALCLEQGADITILFRTVLDKDIHSFNLVISRCYSILQSNRRFKNISLNKIKNRDGLNLLHYAVVYSSVDKVCKLLTLGFYDVEELTGNGLNALHLAVLHNKRHAIQKLVKKGKHGANVYVKIHGKNLFELLELQIFNMAKRYFSSDLTNYNKKCDLVNIANLLLCYRDICKEKKYTRAKFCSNISNPNVSVQRKKHIVLWQKFNKNLIDKDYQDLLIQRKKYIDFWQKFDKRLIDNNYQYEQPRLACSSFISNSFEVFTEQEILNKQLVSLVAQVNPRNTNLEDIKNVLSLGGDVYADDHFGDSALFLSGKFNRYDVLELLLKHVIEYDDF